MSKLTTKYVAITAGGTPQPLIGTKTTGAIVATGGQVVISVSDSDFFDPGDRVYIGVNSDAELVRLSAVGSGTITAPIAASHASGVYVTLFSPMTDFYVQAAEGNTGALYLFYCQNMFKALASHGRSSLAPAITGFIEGIGIIEKSVAGVQPYQAAAANNYGGNPDNSCFYWVDGTTGDKLLVWLDLT